PTVSCRACRYFLVMRQSLVLRGFGTPEARSRVGSSGSIMRANLADGSEPKNPSRPHAHINIFNGIGRNSPPAAAGQGCAAQIARRSAETDGLQVVIGLDDFHQPVLAGTVAAVGVRMVAL